MIPKEMRIALGLIEGDAMEIFLDQANGLILKPYYTEGLTYNHIKSEWQSMNTEERQKLLCELVDHINDPEEE